MARKVNQRKLKKVIYVFWEGESEKAYSQSLKHLFSKQATIKTHREKGTFTTAQAYCNRNASFRGDLEELDELWFFFDTEIDKGKQWDDSWRCVENILAKRKNTAPLKVRLLMTTGCIEYWLLLHYEQTRPAIASPAEKEHILKEVKKHVPSYVKGNQGAMDLIANHYETAVTNGRWTLECLKQDGMPKDEKKRNQWLFKGVHTFTTVHEAVEMLKSL